MLDGLRKINKSYPLVTTKVCSMTSFSLLSRYYITCISVVQYRINVKSFRKKFFFTFVNARALFIYWLNQFLHATAATAVVRLSHCNSVCLSVRPSVTRVDQSEAVQATITKSSLSAAWKTGFTIRKAFP